MNFPSCPPYVFPTFSPQLSTFSLIVRFSFPKYPLYAPYTSTLELSRYPPFTPLMSTFRSTIRAVFAVLHG